MPIYEYRCQSCGHELEKLQKIADPPLVDCPECGKSALTKLISAAGFRLKGGGWYETDFKKDNQRNLAGEGKKGSKSDGQSQSRESKGERKSDSSGSDNSGSGNGGSSSAGQAA